MTGRRPQKKSNYHHLCDTKKEGFGELPHHSFQESYVMNPSGRHFQIHEEHEGGRELSKDGLSKGIIVPTNQIARTGCPDRCGNFHP